MKMMSKVDVDMCLHIASIKSTAVNKTRLFPHFIFFLISTSRFLILAEAFRNDNVASCSTALLSATEKNELGAYVTVPCPSKTNSAGAQRIGLTSSDVTRLVTTEHIRNKYSLLILIAVIVLKNLLRLSILI